MLITAKISDFCNRKGHLSKNNLNCQEEPVIKFRCFFVSSPSMYSLLTLTLSPTNTCIIHLSYLLVSDQSIERAQNNKEIVTDKSWN